MQSRRLLARAVPAGTPPSPRRRCNIHYSLPSATSRVWSTMLAYRRSHEATCSTSPPNGKQLSRPATVALDIAYSPALRLAPNGIAICEVPTRSASHTPMTDVARSRFDMLLVEGFTPSTAGARPRMSDARLRPSPRVNFPSQLAPQFRLMAECTSNNTEPESGTRDARQKRSTQSKEAR